MCKFTFFAGKAIWVINVWVWSFFKYIKFFSKCENVIKTKKNVVNRKYRKYSQLTSCHYEILKWFYKNLKANPNSLLLNEVNWLAQEIGNWKLMWRKKTKEKIRLKAKFNISLITVTYLKSIRQFQNSFPES